MSEAMFVISLLILLWGLRERIERSEALSRKLENLERVRDSAQVYGGDAESVDEEKRRKFLESGGERGQKIRFELACWSSHIVGTALALFAFTLWLNEDQSHTLNDLVKYVCIILAVIWFVWTMLRAESKIARLERDVLWLKHVLRGVHNAAVNMRKNSVDEYVELNDRIDNLKNV